jgi:hypothetical protein
MKTNIRHEICGAVSAQHALVLVDGVMSAATSAWQGLGTAAFANPRAYKQPNMAAKRGAPPRGNPVVI